MIEPTVALALGFVVAAQLAGLICACAVRVAEGSRCQAVCDRLFLVCLGLVAASTAASFTLGPGSWLTSGITLSVMAVAATFDGSRSPGAATSDL